MLATVRPTTNIQGSIRTEFKRMAQVLAKVEGVENRAEVLKKAWDIPDPKIDEQTDTVQHDARSSSTSSPKERET